MAGDKLTSGEVNDRVETCFKLRYSEYFKQREWIKYCHEQYGDKSEKQYHQYWLKSKDLYQDSWRDKLSKQLDPAVNTLIELMASDDEKIRQRAIDQVFRYTGEEEVKVAISGEMSIKLNWGDIETEETESTDI
jgi:hypothetical protein|tara:strand:- start:341 stop:742 length:402 start_codon:yes stop_codon:yes gene_type:complete